MFIWEFAGSRAALDLVVGKTHQQGVWVSSKWRAIFRDFC